MAYVDKSASGLKEAMGSKVLAPMETLITSSPEKATGKIRIECDMVESVTVGVKEGKESSFVNLNLLESGLKDEIKPSDTCHFKVSVRNSPHKVAMKSENRLENVELKSIVDFGGEIKIVSEDETSSDIDIAKKYMEVEKMIVSLKNECKKEAKNVSIVVNENGEGAIGMKKGKRGRKKKVLESSECIGDIGPKKVKVENGGVKVSGRVLRSRAMTMGGSVNVDESRLNESVVGFKRQMEAECLDQTELVKKVYQSSQLAVRPQKKQKRLGRPPKMQGEAGFKRKIKDECFDQIDLPKEVNESGQQKVKRRGRPPKMQGEAGFKRRMNDKCFDQIDLQKEVNESSQLTGRPQKKQKTQKKSHKGTLIKNLKRRGRPPKVQSGNLLTNTKNTNNNLLKAKDVKEGPAEDREINDHTSDEETVKGDYKIELKNFIGGEERRKKQQFVRDQIVSMIMKASWTIEHRPRQGRDYLDAVYVDQKGRTHWSITKAYFSLKKKIEKGDADNKEISAFTPIPDEEMNVLFRSVSKIRSDKNKRKNKISKKICKAEIVFSGEAPPKRTPGKKSKDGKKKKEIHNSAVKMANKSSTVKVKKDKISESAFQRRPKVSQKGRQSRKPCLVARGSVNGLDQDDDDCTMYNGKRNLFSWMIDSGVIMPGGKLLYGEGRRRNKLLEGQVTIDGIHCSCCNEILDISKFVCHGGGKLDQALKNIYYQSGSSLLVCLLESWRKEVGSNNIKFNYVDVKGDDPNDDTCNICGDGGDLICCDGCPSTFHQSCLDIQNFPSGDWRCIYCCCKFCGLVACGATQMDDFHHATNSEMITCCLCEEKFHHSCLQEEDGVNVGSSSLSFCRRKCQELYEQLQTYIGVKFELKEGYSCTLLKRYDLSHALDDPMKVECNSKLAVAFSVMDECFVPIMDERSGINRIHNVVYNCGSNFRRLDYSGFFTAILEKNGELISAASIRIHGNQLAEMPFIGTRNMYRRQGMCHRLLDAIEHALCSLGVEELVIPAIPELFKTWTKVFGFKPLEESTRQAMKGMSMIVFPGTDMLHKPLLNNQFADKNLSPVAVSDDKAVECITVVNDDNALHLETKVPNSPATHLESETPTNSFQKSKIQFRSSDDVTGVKMSPLTSKSVPKNSFDLNLQPAANDTDIQSIDDESISRDPHVCKNPFELSDSLTQVDNNATQPLVLV